LISPMHRFAKVFRTCSILLAAALLVSLPSRHVFAQTAAPQAQAPTSQSGKTPASASENKQESDSSATNEDSFLRTPMVQTFARFVHLDLDKAGWLFEIINFAILFFAIVYPLTRVLPRILRSRSETLQADLIAAEKLTKEAGARLKAVEEKLLKLDDDVAAMRQQMEEESKQDEARIKAAIVDETARVVAAAEQEIVSAAGLARRGLQRFAADLAIEQATRQLVLTPETDKALITDFVASAGSAQGGKN
jgi:F-type H+-transporting ATPase subunit b